MYDEILHISLADAFEITQYLSEHLKLLYCLVIYHFRKNQTLILAVWLLKLYELQKNLSDTN